MKKLYTLLTTITCIILTSYSALQAQVPAPDFWIEPCSSIFADIEFNNPGPSSVIFANSSIAPLSPLTQPPLVPGTSGTFTFNTTFSSTVTISGGPATSIQAPAVITMSVFYDHLTGQTRYYDTEILQMDIQGGSLPIGYMIRESPTNPSLGHRTATELGPGSYLLDSYFDVFLQLSVDGGQNWIPSNNAPSHMNLQPNASIPTMSTWGLIALSGLMLGFGIFFLKNKMV
ncbi:MAG: IPTL-CTERM sorting domain-containing protein [Bacteroidetes bacterium]|jgi:hypothetical protein|nr:IPTL-CTERM sorting domain-containing protein [Bacteroidota bacterium]